MYRNFVFLDTNTLNDYYSAIKGGLTDDQESITTGLKSKSGKGGISVISGAIESETGSEIRKKIKSTDAAKFNELYELMTSLKDITYLDYIDNEMWGSIRRGQILEIEVSVKIPELYNKLNAIGDLMPAMEVLEQITGEDIFQDKEEKKMMTAVMSMMDLSKSKTIPLICESESTEGYKFIVELPKTYLKMDTENLNGEMTLFGKVQKIIPKDIEVEVYNMFPSLKPLIELADNDGDTDMEGLTEKVIGPAIKIIPLALYR